MRILIIISTFFITWSASAQFQLEFHSGTASYSLTGLKEYQQTRKRSMYPDGAVIAESFPSFWFYGVDAKLNLGSWQFGSSVSRGSTGGQISYKDYSGTQREEELLTYNQISTIIAKKWSFDDDRFIVTIDPRVSFVIGTLKNTEYLNIQGSNTSFNYNTTYKCQAVNVAIEPTISLFRRFGPVGITAFAGYHADLFRGAFKSANTIGTLKTNSSGTSDVKMELSGYRLGGSIGLYFKAKDRGSFDRFLIGPGVGLEYGGIGVNATVMTTPHLGMFAGLGYNFDKAGFNGGLRLYMNSPEKHVRPYFTGMYGYNAIIRVSNMTDYNRTFYGTTIGFGIDIARDYGRTSTVAINVPFRSSDVDAYMKNLQQNGVTFKGKLLPVTITFGVRLSPDN